MPSFPFSYLIIAGPTASGKSGLAVEVAQHLNGEIINADSLQVYKDLPILTARPQGNVNGVPHHLYGVMDSQEKSTAAWWVGQAIHHIKDCMERGKIPILTGGTGLYLHTLTHGIAPIPEISLETRAKVFSLQENLKKSFYDYVVAQDPFAARLHPHDTQRLSRALEVFLQTGRSIFVWQNNTNPPLTLPHVWCVLEPERDNLYAQINQRFHAMIQQGALEEVDRLIKHLPSTHMLSRAIGVQELGAYLNKKCSLPEAVEKAQQATRQYAKRQMTWFRNRVQKKIVLCDPNRDTLLQRLLLCGDVLC